jgi:hypothetical protein
MKQRNWILGLRPLPAHLVIGAHLVEAVRVPGVGVWCVEIWGLHLIVRGRLVFTCGEPRFFQEGRR